MEGNSGSEDYSDCTLFVGDLSREVSKEDLYNLFEMVGVVQEAVVKCSNVTGQPMGYGFVRMASRDDAEHALQALAGMNLKGRCIRVGRAERNCRLIVKNLDRSVRFEDLLHIFLPYGSLQMYDSGQEVSVNGFCARILHFVRRADAERAKRDLHMQTFHGRPMHVEWYRHTPEDVVGGETNNSRSEPVVSVHVRFMTIEAEMKVDEHLLYHVFKKYGEVTKISIKALIQDKETNLSRGYAFVHFTPNLIGCQSALEAAAGMDDVMFNGVHFFSKPSQNFHRAHDELLRQDNNNQSQQRQPYQPQQQQQRGNSSPSQVNSNSYPRPTAPSASSRRYPDQSSSGRVVRPPAPQLMPARVRNPQSYPTSAAGRGVLNPSSPYVNPPPPPRYYEDSMGGGYPRIMQYQHEQQPQPEYAPRAPFPPYSEFQDPVDPHSRGLFWSPPNGYNSGYPRSYDYIQDDLLFGPTNDAMKLPDQKRAPQRGGGDVSYPHQQQQLYDLAAHPNEFLRSPYQAAAYGYPLSNGHQHGHVLATGSASPAGEGYPPKEIFPQEYYDPSDTSQELESSSATSRHMGRYNNAMPAESGLNIEASAFLPSNASRMGGHLPIDHYNSGSHHAVLPQEPLENARVPSSYVSSETELMHNRNPDDDSVGAAGGLSDLIDRSLSPDTEHYHAETEASSSSTSPPPPSHGF